MTRSGWAGSGGRARTGPGQTAASGPGLTGRLGSRPRPGTLSVLSSTNIPTTGAPTTVTHTSNLSVNIHRSEENS